MIQFFMPPLAAIGIMSLVLVGGFIISDMFKRLVGVDVLSRRVTVLEQKMKEKQ